MCRRAVSRSAVTALTLASVVGLIALTRTPSASGAPSTASACGSSYAPVLDPANFVAVVDNPYFPLPVGRTLVYTGVKDGQSQTDTVIVTGQKKVILGIAATVVSDVATHDGTAGLDGAQPGIIMEANPQIPDAYRQECYAGQAEDTAWVVATTGSVTVPYGKVRNVLTTLESTRLEPGAYDEKIYGPGIGIVSERALTGPSEVAQLVSVSG